MSWTNVPMMRAAAATRTASTVKRAKHNPKATLRTIKVNNEAPIPEHQLGLQPPAFGCNEH